ncbi:hypothetical protein MSPP1_001027 [Malassezia sp. CBS 17886]|nr:hypothetical protein MSPP1_001027 [Malassezia sp. CBS 17886]
MANGGKAAARLRTLVSGLQTGASTRALPPSLTALTLRVPRTFHERRVWSLMREELPRIVYANPALRVHVEAVGEEENSGGAVVEVQFQDMPVRTIVLGDKPASEVVRELMTMAKFTNA